MNTSKKFYPWLIILLCSLFLFYKYILQVSPSLMTKELEAFYHLDGAGVGNLAATFFYSYLVMQLFVGPLLDRFSPRKLTSLAIAITALGAIGFALAQGLVVVELCRALIGAGAAFATVVYLKMAALWFKPQRFAFVAGLLATAAMLGALCGQAPMAYLIEGQGWQRALFIVGVLGLLLALVFFILVRDRSDVSVPHHGSQLTWRAVLQVLSKKTNWTIAAYSGLVFSPIVVLGGLWGNPFLQSAYHLSKLQSASLLSFMFVGLAIGAPVFGVLSDWLNKRLAVMTVGTCLSLVSILLLLYYPASSLLLVATSLFLFGFGTGVFMLGFTLAKELNPLPLAGTVIALINTGDALLGAITEPVTGRLLDSFSAGKDVFTVSDYQLALSLIPIYLVVGLVLLVVLSRRAK